MTAYSTASDWAAEQAPGSPEAKLLLMLLAFDRDAGEPGTPLSRLARRADIGPPEAAQILRSLSDQGLVEMTELDPGVPEPTRYAPRWRK